MKLAPTGIEIKGPWGIFVPLGGVGDGYSATLAWIADMLGWSVLSDSSAPSLNLSGIVLLDEIEQHLHPKWQKVIVKRLREQFPRIQFIATTHSPLCAIGTTNLTDEECGLFLFQRQAQAVVATGPHTPPRGSRADQVLTGYLFGLYTSGDNATHQEIEEYAQLSGADHRTAAEERRLLGLRNSLQRKLGTPETSLQRSVQEAVQTVLVERGFATQPALDLEVKRQLRDVFGGADAPR